MRRTPVTLLVAIALGAVALLSMADTLRDPVRWTPDALFYNARALELQRTPRDAALTTTFQGPQGAELRAIDPDRSGDLIGRPVRELSAASTCEPSFVTR